MDDLESSSNNCWQLYRCKRGLIKLYSFICIPKFLFGYIKKFLPKEVFNSTKKQFANNYNLLSKKLAYLFQLIYRVENYNKPKNEPDTEDKFSKLTGETSEKE